MKFIFATNNENKIKELRDIASDLDSDIEILSLKDVNLNIDVKETFETLEENAIKKSKVVFKKLKSKLKDAYVISEDFGFFVEEYPEIAGVYSKRWMKGTDEDRNREVVRLMKNIENRKCYYKSVFGVYDGEIERVFSGYTYGVVAEELRGSNGFAYDAIFELENGKTIAELEPKEKEAISSRTEAFKYLVNSLKND